MNLTKEDFIRLARQPFFAAGDPEGTLANSIKRWVHTVQHSIYDEAEVEMARSKETPRLPTVDRIEDIAWECWLARRTIIARAKKLW